MSGSGLGTTAGGVLGSVAGAALAPETGGASLLIPAFTGAAGAELGNAATGNTQNPYVAALMGGIGGGLSGYAGLGSDLGISDSTGLFGDAAGAAGAGATDPSVSVGTLGEAGNGLGADSASAGASTFTPSGASAAAGSTGAATGGSGNTSSMLGNVGNWASKNPLQAALLGETAVSGIQSLLPKKKVNIGQTAAQVEATDPGFNATLPQYKMQNTATPYQGNWYTYGQQPEATMYNAQPQLQAKGGLIKGYAAGGNVSPGNRVNPLAGVMPRLSNALRSNTPPMHGSRFPTAHGYAMGGAVMPGTMPQQAPPQGMPQQQPAQPNPLQLAAVHKMGVAIGQHLKAHGYDPNKTPAGPVHGKGGGQDDAVPAKLSDGEYVHSADVVAALGDGSSKAGGEKLKAMDAHIRAHKTKNGSKFPPKAKANPLSYIGSA